MARRGHGILAGHRKAAAVMHFTSLGYCRPVTGVTSDHWRDVARLEWEPEFQRYLRDAFAPVGLMLDFWNERNIRGGSARVPVRLINDLDRPWSGSVTLRLRKRGSETAVFSAKQEARLEPFGLATLNFPITWPEAAGPYTLAGELPGAEGEPVQSVREIEIVDAKSQ